MNPGSGESSLREDPGLYDYWAYRDRPKIEWPNGARLAFWVALGIPISFCGMFMLALYYGITINVISLFGMILHYEGAWTKAWRMREMPDQEPVEGYPAPNFWNHLVVFQPFGNLHAGLEYAHVVNNGNTLNEGYRLAFYIGYSL